MGGGTRTLARGPFSFAKVFAAPGGRLWLAWGDTNDGLYVTRSNAAGTKFETVQHLKLASGDVAGLANENGNGSAGPLDFFALFQIGGSDRGYWQTHVFPKLSIGRSAGKSQARQAQRDDHGHRRGRSGQRRLGEARLEEG